jgi:hypothetical protein
MPVILATQEAEIRRITVPWKPAWGNNLRDPISKKPITCVHAHTQKHRERAGGVA